VKKDDWDALRRIAQSCDYGRGLPEDHVWLDSSNFYGRGTSIVEACGSPDVVNQEIDPQYPAKRLQTLLQRGKRGLVLRRFARCYNDAQSSDSNSLLCLRSKGPSSRRATQNPHEVAPFHSIASSPQPAARDTARPSAKAVFGFMSNSNRMVHRRQVGDLGSPEIPVMKSRD
jgi:hypothetical protein